uniref:Uncharacterized protein n=1 Tax=Operophtera brumata cypovirus 19 TaxID=352246 RepID=Q30C67_9REOV|nr:unknown [Operophtera brumata cypovirus 19]
MQPWFIKAKNDQQKSKVSLPSFRKLSDKMQRREAPFTDITCDATKQLQLFITDKGLIVCELGKEDYSYIVMGKNGMAKEALLLLEDERRKKDERRFQMMRTTSSVLNRDHVRVIKTISFDDFAVEHDELVTDFNDLILEVNSCRGNMVKLGEALQTIGNGEINMMDFHNQLKFLVLYDLFQGKKPIVDAYDILLNGLDLKQMLTIGKWSSAMLKSQFVAVKETEMMRPVLCMIGKEQYSMPSKLRFYGMTTMMNVFKGSSLLFTTPMTLEGWTTVTTTFTDDRA